MAVKNGSWYPPEFRASAIRLCRPSGKSLAAVCSELGIAVESLRHWIKQADLDGGKRKDGLTSEKRVELNYERKTVSPCHSRYSREGGVYPRSGPRTPRPSSA